MFVANGLVLYAVGAVYMAACVLAIAYFYGDHDGKVAFVFEPGTRGRAAPVRPAVVGGRPSGPG